MTVAESCDNVKCVMEEGSCDNVTYVIVAESCDNVSPCQPRSRVLMVNVRVFQAGRLFQPPASTSATPKCGAE